MRTGGGGGGVQLSFGLRFHSSVFDDEVDSQVFFGANPLVFFLSRFSRKSGVLVLQLLSLIVSSPIA